MQILLREIAEGADGSIEQRDRLHEGPDLRIGSAPDSPLQILGAGLLPEHAVLRIANGAPTFVCPPGATIALNGEPVRKATPQPGDVIGFAGSTLRCFEPPAGFDAAFEIRLDRDIPAAIFQAAFKTDLEQTFVRKRGPAWLLALGILAIGLLVPWFVPLQAAPWWATDQIWSTGPLHPAHRVAVGNDCALCHGWAFQRVPDENCTFCHLDVAEHAGPELQQEVGLNRIRCASCHKEHNEPAYLTVDADALCTDCHATPHWSGSAMATVAGFGDASHPEFEVDLLQASATPAGTGMRYDWDVVSASLAVAKDRSNLKFPHDVHLDPSKVRPNDATALHCRDCHSLASDDEHFEPVAMEQHCSNCHDLSFDRSAPDRQLPHGDPAEALLVMEGHYMRLYADPTAAAPERPRRRLPGAGGRSGDSTQCDGEAWQCATERTRREAVDQFTQRGCVTCHEVIDHGGDDLLARFQVVPIRLTGDFYQGARFDHGAHLTQLNALDDVAADDLCLGCHAASTSASSSDVLMPDVDNCRTCHADHSDPDRVPLHCIDCHSFHPHTRWENP